MAGLIKHHKKYYARIRMPKGSLKTEVRISLHTENEKEARFRRNMVESKEDDIKAGLDYTFPWESAPKRRQPDTLASAKKKYLAQIKVDGIRQSTIDVYTLALDHFSAVIGKRFRVHEITLKHIDLYKHEASTSKKLAPDTVNIRLRAIKTFLRWLHDRDQLAKVPKIKQLPALSREPKYISNSDFKSILEHTPEELKPVFNFYRDTGCRLSEPFKGKLEGNYLVVSAKDSKSGATRVIPLTKEQIKVWNWLQEHTHLPTADKKGLRAIRRTHDVKHYSRAFAKACEGAKITGKKFHCLRHTFALREYLRTRDIYHVQKCLGHSTITATEIYTRFNLQKLEQDFPDLVQKQWKLMKAM